MIYQIELENFKCFKNRTLFPLSRLTLLTGTNGRGKSTLLQSILIFYQSYNNLNKNYRHFSYKPYIFLNGEILNIGTIDDIRNCDTIKSTPIKVGFNFNKDNKNEIIFELIENEADEMVLNVNKITSIINNQVSIIYETRNISNSLNISNNDKEIFNEFNLVYSFFKDIKYVHYIAADRQGPLKYHDKINFDNFINVGPKGEWVINVLAKMGSSLVNDKLYLGNDAITLLQQTEEWLNYIFDGAKIDIKGKGRDSSVYYVLYNSKSTKDRFKPSNVGFGFSYILPIIVAGLIAKKGEILIVENPEAHLHPKAQSRIAEFLSKVASCEVQIIIESHSEHILNGIRISTLNRDIELNYSDTTILYFQNNEEIPFIKLDIDGNGKISEWVDGFFDQQEIDLANIFKLNQNKNDI